MDCLSPIYLDDPDEFDWNCRCRESGNEHLLKKIAVPCGHCEACIYNSAQEWRVRINEEFYNSNNALFVTLTYNDESLPLAVGTNFSGESVVVPSVCKRDIQLFLKRLRASFSDSKIRYYIVSEYGPTTLRPHYHGLLFNIPDFDPRSPKSLCKVSELISEKWDNGFVKCDLVNPARVGYVTKYLSCTMDLPCEYTKPFRLMSLRPAIGSSYFDNLSLIQWHKDNLNAYVVDGNYKLRMPRYYKRHIFDDDELLMIRQLYDERRRNLQNKFDEDFLRSEFYSGRSPIQDSIDKFKRNFNKKYTKKRRDL